MIQHNKHAAIQYASVIVLALTISSMLIACTEESKQRKENETTIKVTEDVIMATDGDIVSVHYHGTLDNGQIFDSSKNRGEPLKFTVGGGQVIPGFNDAVLGLAVGESVKVRMEPAQAYGEKNEQLIFEVPSEGAPEGLKEGDRVQLSNGAPAVVIKINDASITLDANHELAGQALTFEIELVSVN